MLSIANVFALLAISSMVFPGVSWTTIPSAHAAGAKAPKSRIGGACTVCLENVSDHDIEEHKAYACSKHHCIDRECLVHQVTSLENVQELETNGLPCCSEKCQEKLSLTAVRQYLPEEDRIALDARLAKAANQGVVHQVKTEVERLSRGIEEAFNLCCPRGGCGAVLDKIEGCNAATCSNQSCKATFCYLCLEKQKNSRAAHQHAKEHSGDYWERRPGFTERYHWLLARQKMEFLFEGQVSPEDRAAALESRKALLVENKMWPFPAGLPVNAWIEEIKGAKLPPEQAIELLQNEYIFHSKPQKFKLSLAFQTKKKLNQVWGRNKKQVASEIKRLGGKVLASLDLKDIPDASIVEDQIIPVMANDPRVPPEFATIDPGHMYQVGHLIWSGVSKLRIIKGHLVWTELRPRKVKERKEGGEMKYLEAEQFCQSRGGGSRLPSRAEYEALVRAMTENGRYIRGRIPDMDNEWGFWALSARPGDSAFAFVFDSITGNVVNVANSSGLSAVRCVLPML